MCCSCCCCDVNLQGCAYSHIATLCIASPHRCKLDQRWPNCCLCCIKQQVSRRAEYDYLSVLHRCGALIDAILSGNEARFINHSCEPNCQAEYWTVEGQERVGIFPKTLIVEGQEITYDYHAVCAAFLRSSKQHPTCVAVILVTWIAALVLVSMFV